MLLMDYACRRKGTGNVGERMDVLSAVVLEVFTRTFSSSASSCSRVVNGGIEGRKQNDVEGVKEWRMREENEVCKKTGGRGKKRNLSRRTRVHKIIKVDPSSPRPCMSDSKGTHPYSFPAEDKLNVQCRMVFLLWYTGRGSMCNGMI